MATTTDLSAKIASLSPTLYGFTHRFTSNRDESLDLVQDTIAKALTYIDKYREDTNLQGWLFTIMRNIFINNYRKSKRVRFSHDTTDDLHYLNVEDGHTFSSPESQYRYADIWKHIDNLREEYKVPFKLHTSGYKYHEIAELLRIPIGTVKNRIFHARQELQSLLASN